MLSLKRLFQGSVFVVCAMISTVVFPAAAAADDVAVPNPAQAPEASSLQQQIDFGALFTPEPINRSCTATSQCTPVGGIPKSCAGNSTCSSYANWVTCDGTAYPCTCNPAGISNCIDPEAFCECWNLAPLSYYTMCRREHCLDLP